MKRVPPIATVVAMAALYLDWEFLSPFALALLLSLFSRLFIGWLKELTASCHLRVSARSHFQWAESVRPATAHIVHSVLELGDGSRSTRSTLAAQHLAIYFDGKSASRQNADEYVPPRRSNGAKHR